MAPKNSSLTDASSRALREFNQLTVAHKEFVSQYEINRRSYQGVIDDANVDQAEWWENIAPPYAEHIIETTIASMLDEQFRFRVRPKGRMFQSSAQVQQAKEGAEAMQLLLDQQLKLDYFDEKQRPLVLQERLAGISPVKVYWRSEGRNRMRTKWSIDPITGQAVWDRVEEPETIRDGPCVEVCDVRDFFWDDAASSLDNAQMVAHRTWPTYEECLEQQRRGRWHNVEDLKIEREQSHRLEEREHGDPDKKRGRIEVVEIWRREDSGKIHVYVIGERRVLLTDYDNPFDHGQFPFVLFVGQSQPFRIPGRPQIEKLTGLQNAAWTVMNTRLQNLMLINNAVTIVNEDLVDDPDAADVYPGARWAAHGDANAAYQMWNPNPTPAQISIPAESMIKADMQNLAGGFPFTSTTEANNVGANTATEASLVASLAQRSIMEAKRHLYETYRRIGQMWIDLNQQFTREPVYALVVGADDTFEQKEILPSILEGEWVFDIEPMTESLMRQERRSEALSLFTTVMPTLQIGAMTGALVNSKRMYSNLFESFDIQDVEGMFLTPPQQGTPPGQPPGPQGQGMPGMASPPAINVNGGVTNPGLAAGPMAPSNGASMSPMAPMQQMLADTTPRNA